MLKKWSFNSIQNFIATSTHFIGNKVSVALKTDKTEKKLSHVSNKQTCIFNPVYILYVHSQHLFG